MTHAHRSKRRPSPLRLPALAIAALAACQGSRSASEAPPLEAPTVAEVDPSLEPAQQAGRGSSGACDRPADGLAVEPLDPARGSAVVLGRADGKIVALVADADTHRLHTVDVATMRELAVTTLSGAPSQVLLLSSGRVAVALRDTSQVELLDFRPALDQPLAPACSVDVPTEPVALAATRDSLFVASRWAASIAAVDLPSGERGLVPRVEVPVSRDPASLTLTKGALWVLHATGGELDRIPLERFSEARSEAHRTRTVAADEDGKLLPQDAARGRRGKPPRRQASQGFALASTKEGQVFASVALVDPAPPESPDEDTGYGVGFDVVRSELLTVSAAGAVKLSETKRVAGQVCPLPRDAVHSARRRSLLVACAGLDNLVSLPVDDDAALVQQAPAQYHVGSGPSGLALDDERGFAYVWGAFDGALTAVALDENVKALGERADDVASRRGAGQRFVTAVVLRREPVLDPERELGRRLFHDTSGRVSGDGRACASCHPDGRDDGLTWRTKEGLRQTPMLVGRIEGTAPYGWNGDLPLEGHFDRTIQRLGGHGLRPHEREAIFAWLKGLEPPGAAAGPVLVAMGREGELVSRGKDVFHSAEAQCGTCHAFGSATDGLPHDVRSGLQKGDTRTFETPSLRFVAKSAPYYHDGRYDTLEALLVGSDHAMGRTGHLSEADKSALLAYLRSL